MRIRILTTRNGWIVLTGPDETISESGAWNIAVRCWSFHSIDKTLAKIRELLVESRHPNKPEPPK